MSNTLISTNLYAKNQAPIHYMDIWFADIPLQIGTHVQGGARPVIVISNNTVNHHGPIISVIPLTTNLGSEWMPSHERVDGYGLHRPSLALTDQITTIDKRQLIHPIGHIWDADKVASIQSAMMNHMGFTA